MNYGHPIEFGTFITPMNDPPETAVALAKRNEELGYDLVTFQDLMENGAALRTTLPDLDVALDRFEKLFAELNALLPG